jgi:hypothetical protein
MIFLQNKALATPPPCLYFSCSLIKFVGGASHDVSSCMLSYGPPWAHYLGGYQDRLLGGPLGLLGLCYTAPDGMRRKEYGGEVLR